MANAKSISHRMDSTLKQLEKKEQSEFLYSINEKDLLHIDHCPLCESSKTRRISEVTLNAGLMFFATETCSECLHVWRSVSPSRFWFQERWKQISTGDLEVFNPGLEEARGQRYGRYLDVVSRQVKSGLVLDIGAAYGTGAKRFIDAGYSVEAVEPEDDRAHYIREKLGIKVYSTPLEEMKPTERYDAILFAHCLEHLDDPVSMLAEVSKWLKPGGVLYLEIPLVANIVDWRDAFFMAHKSNFTAHNAAKLAQRVGLTLLDVFLVPDSEADPDNLGMLLTRKDKASESVSADHLDPKDLTVEKICKLYRKDLPFAQLNKETACLHYNVPYINQFYYIVRIQQGQFVDETATTGFIEFVHKT